MRMNHLGPRVLGLGVADQDCLRPGVRELRYALVGIACAAVISVIVLPKEVWGDGIFEGISGSSETNYSFVSTKTTDAAGNTLKTGSNNYGEKFTLNINHDLFPKLNLNAGGNFEKGISDPTNDEVASRTELTRIRPFAWLTLRDPIFTATLGYDLKEDSIKTAGLPKLTLIQENYNAFFDWRPDGFPSTRLNIIRTNTHDEPQSTQDREQNFASLKSQYTYKGLDATYTGAYLNTRDNILNSETTQWSNEGRLSYVGTLFNGRTSINSDNRVNVTTIENIRAGQGQIDLPVLPIGGLGLDPNLVDNDTPVLGTLDQNPGLIDGNLTTSAGVNIGVAPPGDPRRRNFGLQFSTSVELNDLLVWIDRELTQDIANSFIWDIYTSTNNLTWTLIATVPALFTNTTDSSVTPPVILGHFDIRFPTVRTQFIKVVTRPLSPAVPGASSLTSIFITEMQAFLDTPAQNLQGSTTQVFQNYNLDIKTRLFDTPLLYYDLNSFYTAQDPNGQRNYNVSNGLFFNQQLTPILTSSANASVEFGAQGDKGRIAFLYYASLLANPLRTVSNSLVFSGNNQNIEGLASRTNSVALYNNAQLYKGIDANLNLGLNFTSQGLETGGTLRRTDVFANLGTTLTPRSDLTFTANYFGRKSYQSGGTAVTSPNTTENRLDLGLSYNPFRTLFLSATVSVVSATNSQTTVQQNYGLNWSPFPDGNLQFSFFFNENRFPDQSRVIQPTLRWYLGAKRRSYLDLSYQFITSDFSGLKTDTTIISTTLKIYF
jgi:hypothetical protein